MPSILGNKLKLTEFFGFVILFVFPSFNGDFEVICNFVNKTQKSHDIQTLENDFFQISFDEGQEKQLKQVHESRNT